MPEYEITAVSPNVRDWNSTQGGPMKGYRIDLRDGTGNVTSNCEWSRKTSSPAPTVGQKVTGDIDIDAPYGPKFKAAANAHGGGGGGSRPRDPQERRSIQIQSATRTAVDVLRLAIECGVWKPNTVSETTDAVTMIARKLFALAEEVAQ